MPDHQAFSDQVNEFFSGNYEITSGTTIPEAANIQFGNVGKEMELAMLFIDLRESTKIVDGFRRQTAAKMYKSFLWGVAKIARENGGELRSFNGDGVLIVFAGDLRCTHAVTAAMQMSYFIHSILKPKVDAYLRNNRETANLSLEYGIGIDTGKVLVVRGGVRGDNNNDLVWVGNATNYAVKLSNFSDKSIGAIRVMPSVHAALPENLKFKNQMPLRVALWNQKTFPVKLAQVRFAPPPSPSTLSFLNPNNSPPLGSSLLKSLAVPNNAPFTPPPKYYLHTAWHIEF